MTNYVEIEKRNNKWYVIVFNDEWPAGYVYMSYKTKKRAVEISEQLQEILDQQ